MSAATPTQPLSPLRLKKLHRRFQMTDTDKSGYVDAADYQRLAQLFTKLNGLAPDSPEAQRFSTGYAEAWERLRKGADSDGDNRVGLDEYVAYFSVDAHVRAYLDELRVQLLAMMDRDGDGQISRAEYVANARIAGASEPDATEVFGRLDRDGDGFLSQAELHQAAEEYYLGDDPAAPGNDLLGRLN